MGNHKKILSKIVVISAHPDDEALGSGGTLLKSKKIGHEVHFLFMTNGISSRSMSKEDLNNRSEGLNRAMNFFSPSSYKALDYPDNKLDMVPLLEITKEVEDFLKKIKPDILITHFANDLNIDHRITFQACMTACRPGSTSFVKKILSFEVLSATDWNLGALRFSPNYFVDISDCIDEKISYLNCYSSEIKNCPNARSLENIRALSRLRGSEVFVHNAEGFMLLRNLKNEL